VPEKCSVRRVIYNDVLTKIFIPQNYAYSSFLVPEKCSVRRVIFNDEDENDIDADAASENSESLSVHDDY
jgi:hypothetical protein